MGMKMCGWFYLGLRDLIEEWLLGREIEEWKKPLYVDVKKKKIVVGKDKELRILSLCLVCEARGKSQVHK